MSAEVPDLQSEPLEVRALYPGQWWNVDRDEKRAERTSELEEKLPSADVVGVVDSDSDGLACEVVLREAYEDNSVVVIQSGGEYGFGTVEALQIVAENTNKNTDVIVADLAPDKNYSPYMAAISNIEGDVSVYDHHDWPWFVEDCIRGVCTELILEEDKCAAQILQEHRYESAGDQLLGFLEATADHDLWRKENYLSDHLSTLAFELDRDMYVYYARSHGAYMVRDNPGLQKVYDESEAEAERRADLAVESAQRETLNGYDIAVTYLDCHQSRVGDKLIDDGADLVVIIQPTLSVSFRSSEQTPIAADLARELGGGGHPTAAGAKLHEHVDAELESVWENAGSQPIEFMFAFLQEQLE